MRPSFVFIHENSRKILWNALFEKLIEKIIRMVDGNERERERGGMRRSPDRRNSLSSSSKHSPRKLCVDTRSRFSRLLRGRTTSGTPCNRPRFSTSCKSWRIRVNRIDRNRRRSVFILVTFQVSNLGIISIEMEAIVV